jgi:hypothetical protein
VILLLLFSYVTSSHTAGLRIRFVRFRQSVWRVMHLVTIVRQYNGETAGTSTGVGMAMSARQPIGQALTAVAG